MTEQKKSTNGRLINVSIDRRRKILFSILFKAIGMSFNLGDIDDPNDTTQLETFLAAMGRRFPSKPKESLIAKRDEYESEKNAIATVHDALAKRIRDGKSKDANAEAKLASLESTLEQAEE